MVPIEYILHILYGYIFFFLNDPLIIEYNFLMFWTNFSMFSMISLIKVAVFILYWLDYSFTSSSESSTIISFGIMIYSIKHSIDQLEGWLLK